MALQTKSEAKLEIGTLQVMANNNTLEFLRIANEHPELYSECMAQVKRSEEIVERLEGLKDRINKIEL